MVSRFVAAESLANPYFSRFLPSHPALSRVSQISCLFTAISVDRLELITKHDCYVSRNVNCFVSFIVQEMETNPFFGPNTWDQALAQ